MTTQQETKPGELQFTVRERAIIYCRVSTDEQAESGTSLAYQEERNHAYAQANNMEIVTTFREDYSGKTLERPELKKVREMFQNGLADNLIVFKPNRLDRSEWGVNLLVLMQELKTLGVGLHYSQDNRRVDLHNPMEVLVYGSVGGWQAGEDHRETVTKLHLGRLNRARQGNVVPNGKTLFGYKKIEGDNKKLYFEIFEREAKIVKMIFEWYTVDGLTFGKIANKLNEIGIPSPGGKQWRRETVRVIVINESYCGVWHYGKRNGTSYKKTDDTIPVTIPAIVSRETWAAAQERIEENKHFAKRNRKPGRYLFANRVKCGDCGHTMIGSTNKAKGYEYRYYRCRNRYFVERERYCECHNTYYHSEVVDFKAWNWIEEIAKDEDKLREGLQGYQSQRESKVEPIKRELAFTLEVIKEKEQELDDEMENLNVLTSKRAKAKKGLDIAQVEQVLDGLEAKRTTLLAQLEEKSITDEQIMGILVFAAEVARDIDTLKEAEEKGKGRPELKRAVYEVKRKLLAVLDVQVILFLENGERKARITAKMCPNGNNVLSVETCNTHASSYDYKCLKTMLQHPFDPIS